MRRNNRGGGAGRGRGAPITKQEQQLVMQLQGQRKAPDAKAIGKDVNQVARPAFEKHPPLDYSVYRKDMLKKFAEASLPTLPEIKVFDPQASGAIQPETISMASYPRSGNTLLRTWVERVTGIFTGSDGNNQGALHQALMDIGLEGEGVADKRIQFVKTHFPERSGSIFYSTQKTVLLVRSPLDCIISLFHMDCTGTHDCSILDSDFVAYRSQWEQWVKNEITVWRDFHNYWLQQTEIPLHVIRYEDLVARPGEVIPDMMKFAFNQQDISDSLVQKFIELAVAEGAQKTYKPRVGKANVNMDKYSQATLDLIAKESKQLLQQFGFYHLCKQADGSEFEVHSSGRIPWIQDFNESQLKQFLAHNAQPRHQVGSLPFVMINNKDLMVREQTYDPIGFPYGRGFQRISRYMMPRATKIGKTLIDMSIKTGDRIVVGKKDNKVHVDLLNPTADMLKDCAVDDETALQAKLEAEKIAEATLLQQKSTHEHAPSDKELVEPIAAEPDTPATVAEESKEDSTETEKQKSLDALADKALKAKQAVGQKRAKEDRDTLAFIDETVFEQADGQQLTEREQYEQELRALEALQEIESKFDN